jgi:hypothetical protein
MSSLWIAALCLVAADPPIVEVTNVAEAAALKADAQRVRIVMKDHQTLATVFKQVPNLKYLNLDHPGHRMPLESFKLLGKFNKLKTLHFEGDPFLSDEKFALLGKLSQLKTLHMALP